MGAGAAGSFRNAASRRDGGGGSGVCMREWRWGGGEGVVSPLQGSCGGGRVHPGRGPGLRLGAAFGDGGRGAGGG